MQMSSKQIIFSGKGENVSFCALSKKLAKVDYSNIFIGELDRMREFISSLEN